jgi:hypothetical protein
MELFSQSVSYEYLLKVVKKFGTLFGMEVLLSDGLRYSNHPFPVNPKLSGEL